ncbi:MULTISPECIES: hypothetical protein [Streptococcus]|uniref:hypothetical protein n=1 Tax=Streptococcus TaxID=1301 RepID=UPI0012D23058|nr:hypothetical protein [Streptococcus dysgalactiae]GET71245.1 hypothetical protein KNZ03_18040 [Streptococcus dysgalactiae subsp. equisimilis]
MGIYEALKDVVNLANGSNDLLLQRAVLNLQSEFIILKDENRALRDRIIELENDKLESDQLEFHFDYYYRPKDNRIFCKQCWESDRKLFTLESSSDYVIGGANYCRNCKNFFTLGYEDSIKRTSKH